MVLNIAISFGRKNLFWLGYVSVLLELTGEIRSPRPALRWRFAMLRRRAGMAYAIGGSLLPQIRCQVLPPRCFNSARHQWYAFVCLIALLPLFCAVAAEVPSSSVATRSSFRGGTSLAHSSEKETQRCSLSACRFHHGRMGWLVVHPSQHIWQHSLAPNDGRWRVCSFIAYVRFSRKPKPALSYCLNYRSSWRGFCAMW
jgi:hypothetical protein